MDKKRAVILSCRTTKFGLDEAFTYEKHTPLGFILFRHNCQNVKQVADLTKSIRNFLKDDKAPILIDQEGGRVTRLKPPNWPATPAFGDFGKLAKKDLPKAKELLRINCQAISAMLNEVGINVVASPCLDLNFSFGDRVIFNRSFSDDPNLVKTLGKVAVDEFLANRITPIIKHLPGHGRALVDTHFSLPTIKDDLKKLEKTDFAPFYHVKYAPWAMLAHIKYSQLDAKSALTTSPKAVNFVKNYFKYKGVLITDSIHMQALKGSTAQRAQKAFKAGFDIVLSAFLNQSHFDLSNNLAVLKKAPLVSENLTKKLKTYAPSYASCDLAGKRIDYFKDIDFVNRQML